MHSSHRGANQGEKVLNLVALLEVGNEAAIARESLWRISTLPQQHLQLPAGLQMRGIELQMVPLQRVRQAAAGKKGPSEKRRSTALLLQQSKVDVEDQILPGVIAQQIDDMVQLPAVRDLKHHLPRCLRLWETVKLHIEGSLEELWKTRGKIGVFCNNPDLRGTESIAIEQNAIGLRPGAAELLHWKPAQLIFGIKGKGHGFPPGRSDRFLLFLMFHPIGVRSVTGTAAGDADTALGVEQNQFSGQCIRMVSDISILYHRHRAAHHLHP